MADQMAKLEIIYVNPNDLIPYVGNSRTHSEEQVIQIASSIKEFGFTNPILLDEENGIIAGHGRLAAAKKLGMTEVPAIYLDDLSPAQKRALVIADNKLALNAGWDLEQLSAEFKLLEEEGYDLSITGFNADELAGFLDEPVAGLTDEDSVPEAPESPVTVEGDLWVLGDHRLICGDSTVATTVEKLLDGVKPHLMVTDPPYGVEYDANWRNEAMRPDGSPIGGRAVGKVSNDDNADWSEAWALFPGDVAYVWHAGNMANIVADSLIACDFNIRAQIIWAKSNLVIGRGDYHPKHEPCWYAVKKNKKGHYCGDRKQTTLWEINKPQKSETGHSTQKPIECMRKPIENNSSPGQAIYEPFCGSGTTVIAAEQTGRHCYAIELNPAYCDVIIKRWQDFTGLDAVNEDGVRFDDLLEEGEP
jgi:DNA modification methylase